MWTEILEDLQLAEDACETIESRLEMILEDINWAGYQDTERACQEALELTWQALVYIRRCLKQSRRMGKHEN